MVLKPSNMLIHIKCFFPYCYTKIRKKMDDLTIKIKEKITKDSITQFEALRKIRAKEYFEGTQILNEIVSKTDFNNRAQFDSLLNLPLAHHLKDVNLQINKYDQIISRLQQKYGFLPKELIVGLEPEGFQAFADHNQVVKSVCELEKVPEIDQEPNLDDAVESEIDPKMKTVVYKKNGIEVAKIDLKNQTFNEQKNLTFACLK